MCREKGARTVWRGKEYSRMNIGALFNATKNLSDSTRMQYVDINMWLSGDILAKADKMTMAYSLELRVPFLDIKVADFARTIPDRLKFMSGTTMKYLLRKAGEGLVPKTTQKRKKLGFPVPLAQWLRSRTDWQEKLLKHSFVISRFNIEIIKKLIDDHVSGRANNARKLFIFIMLSAWYDAYYGEKGF